MIALPTMRADVSLTSFVFDEGREWRQALATTPTTEDAATEAAIVIAGVQEFTRDASPMTEALLIASFVRGVSAAGLPLAD
jgi:hypothetical protein